MLTKVEVISNQGQMLSLPLAETSGGFVVKDIEGLNPVRATLVSSSFAQQDGSQYQSARRDNRNIVLTLGYAKNVLTVEELRHRLYAFFMPKSSIRLQFYLSSGLVVHIYARVETFETALFSKDPAVVVSTLAFDPDFFEPEPTTYSSVSTATTTDDVITYDGTVETGVLFSLAVNRVLTMFTIYHRPANDILRQLDFAGSLSAGDVLEISTIPGAKRVTLIRSGSASSMLYGMSPQSNWIELMPGDNNLRVYAEGAGIPYSITYTNKYGGL